MAGTPGVDGFWGWGPDAKPDASGNWGDPSLWIPYNTIIEGNDGAKAFYPDPKNPQTAPWDFNFAPQAPAPQPAASQPAAPQPAASQTPIARTQSAPLSIPQNTWNENITYAGATGIKQADPDIIVFDEEVDPEFLVQAFFQEFGGTELINISRYDLINGDDVSYSPIINLRNLKQSFNSNNIIGIGAFQENPTKYGIDLFSRGVVEPYFNNDGDLVIEINNVRPDESVEVEIASDGTINRIEL